MKYYTFYRENNNFEDILSDAIVKKITSVKIQWLHHLMIGVDDSGSEQSLSIITLKYSDDMVTSLTKDYSPVPFLDYQPKKDSSKFVKSIS